MSASAAAATTIPYSFLSLFLGGVTIGLGIAIGTALSKSLVKNFRRWSSSSSVSEEGDKDEDGEDNSKDGDTAEVFDNGTGGGIFSGTARRRKPESTTV